MMEGWRREECGSADDAGGDGIYNCNERVNNAQENDNETKGEMREEAGTDSQVHKSCMRHHICCDCKINGLADRCTGKQLMKDTKTTTHLNTDRQADS